MLFKSGKYGNLIKTAIKIWLIGVVNSFKLGTWTWNFVLVLMCRSQAHLSSRNVRSAWGAQVPSAFWTSVCGTWGTRDVMWIRYEKSILLLFQVLSLTMAMVTSTIIIPGKEQVQLSQQVNMTFPTGSRHSVSNICSTYKPLPWRMWETVSSLSEYVSYIIAIDFESNIYWIDNPDE